MYLYSKRNVRMLSFILTIFLFSSIYLMKVYFFQENRNTNQDASTIILKIEKMNEKETIENEQNLETVTQTKNIDELVEAEKIYQAYSWRIQIPKIQLNAPIYEGTTQETMRRGVGHFSDTSTWDGNICLAAHNRGYKYNYFQQIDMLAIGDEIIYQTEKGKKTFIVSRNEKIKETNWTYLQQTQENQITLITCEKNEPNYRRCVQAIEKR